MRKGFIITKPGIISFFVLIVSVGAIAFFLILHTSAVTFPTTPVLDNFNRAGTADPPSASWTNGVGGVPVVGDQGGIKLTGDSATAQSDDSAGTSFDHYVAALWNASTFGPDTEVYATVGGTLNTTGNEDMSLYTRVNNSTNTWYEVEFDTGTTNNITVSTHSSTIGTLSQSFSAGDSFGVKTTGTGATVTNQVWYKPAGGSWTSVGSLADSRAGRITTSGNIAVEVKNAHSGSPVNNITLDDFGGGTVVVNSAPAAPTLSSPSNSATNVSTLPVFTLRTADADNDYLDYEIQVCSNSDCSSVVRTVCQVATLPCGGGASQTGWSGMDANSSTAYVGNATIGSSTMATHTYQAAALSGNTQYWWRAYAIDPGGSITSSGASSIFSFTTSHIPAAPTLSSPADTSKASTTPAFQLRTTDADNDYLDYEIQVCSNSDCSSVVRTVCQVDGMPNSCTGSQTGWSGMDANSSTAYVGNSSIGSSTMATHTYQAAALTTNTQYWWRAYAIDPGGSNAASSASSIFSFTTNTTPAAPTLVFPGSGNTGVSTLPLFQLRTTDPDSDYLKYFIQLYSATACGGSQVGSDIDQTSSLTGWQGRDADSANSYDAYRGSSSIGGSTIARYYYSGAALTPNHLYSWRAKAIDPGGSNAFSSLTSCQDFTTGATEVQIDSNSSIDSNSAID